MPPGFLAGQPFLSCSRLQLAYTWRCPLAYVLQSGMGLSNYHRNTSGTDATTAGTS